MRRTLQSMLLFPLLMAGMMMLRAGLAQQERTAMPDTTHALVTGTKDLQSHAIPDSILKRTDLRSLTIVGMDCDVRMVDSMGRDTSRCWMIREIPAEIARLQHLEELRLPVNAIATVPAVLAQLPRLRMLDLGDNPGLRDVEALASLVNLEELNLSGCSISTLPRDLSSLRRLKRMLLFGNNFSRAELARIRKALPGCDVRY